VKHTANYVDDKVTYGSGSRR